MAEQRVDTGFYIHEIGIAAGLAIWGFRACARGAENCCAIRGGFENAFGKDAWVALSNLSSFTNMLASFGRRPVYLSSPGCAKISPDEQCIIAVLATAQSANKMQLNAQLSWLIGAPPTAAACDISKKVGLDFTKAGLTIRQPSELADNGIVDQSINATQLTLVQGGLH